MLRFRVPFKSNRLFNCFKRHGISPCKYNHNKLNNTDFCMEKLQNRKIIRISGEGSSDFLQGLITNDISNLTSAMYAMFLNNKGRVLFDSIIYQSQEKDTFLLETDSEAVYQLIKHLNIYKLRRKVDISSLGSEVNVWCIYNTKYVDLVVEKLNRETKPSIEKFEIGALKNKNIIITPDPRTTMLGYRMLLREGEEGPNLPVGDLYQIWRYKLGIGEGLDEFLVGQSFPLEMNCDYLQGVSFSKGCYIGQELTARTFHTGVIRKRLMPLVFESEVFGVPVNTPIEDLTHARKSPIGKVRAVKAVNGIGLMRVSETVESESLKVLSYIARSYVPIWWPEETMQQTFVKVKK